eukprot:17359-Heterococcus_DN1.PRE.6
MAYALLEHAQRLQRGRYVVLHCSKFVHHMKGIAIGGLPLYGSKYFSGTPPELNYTFVTTRVELPVVDCLGSNNAVTAVLAGNHSSAKIESLLDAQFEQPLQWSNSSSQLIPYSSKAIAPHSMAVAQYLHFRVQRTADETQAAAVAVCAAHGKAGGCIEGCSHYSIAVACTYSWLLVFMM